MDIIKVQFKKYGKYCGKEYSYATTLKNVKVGDFLVTDSPSGTNIVKVCEIGVPERAVAAFRDKLRTISKGLPEVGDEIEIIKLLGAENSEAYKGLKGTVTRIDDAMQLHGTWSALAIIPEVDEYRVTRYAG